MAGASLNGTAIKKIMWLPKVITFDGFNLFLWM